MPPVLIHNQSRPGLAPLRAQMCSSFACRLRGLMLRRSLGAHDGLLMVQPSTSRADAAIHMLFMNFDISVIWMDDHLQVVDTRLARRWRPAYVPAGPARYVLEAHPDRLRDFQAGDQLVIELCDESSS